MNKRNHFWTILQEECAEIIQQVSKIKRFGLTNIQPASGKLNLELVNDEFNDFIASIELLFEDGIPFTPDRAKIDAKKAKVLKFLEVSREAGTYEGD